MMKVDVEARMREVVETAEEWGISYNEAVFNLLLDFVCAQGIKHECAWDLLGAMTNEARKDLYLNLKYEV